MNKYFLLAYFIMPIFASLQLYVPGPSPVARPLFLSPFHNARLISLSNHYRDECAMAIQRRHHLYAFLETAQERHFVVESLTAATCKSYYTNIPADNYYPLITAKVKALTTHTYDHSQKPPLKPFPYNLSSTDALNHFTPYYDIFREKVAQIEESCSELYILQNDIFASLVQFYKNNAADIAANPNTHALPVLEQSQTQIRAIALRFMSRFSQSDRGLFLNTFTPRLDEFSEKLITDLNAITIVNPEALRGIKTIS